METFWRAIKENEYLKDRLSEALANRQEYWRGKEVNKKWLKKRRQPARVRERGSARTPRDIWDSRREKDNFSGFTRELCGDTNRMFHSGCNHHQLDSNSIPPNPKIDIACDVYKRTGIILTVALRRAFKSTNASQESYVEAHIGEHFLDSGISERLRKK
uniref:MADF domain-containing protein n=1 Tax=Caenorhabditis tropicalis TaxID=1561998 RepID=A0A1I7V3U3_9PELO